MNEYEKQAEMQQSQMEEERISRLLLGNKDPRQQQIKFKESSQQTETPIEFVEKLVQPSKPQDSDSHNYIVRDPALSRLPSTDYAEIMADYTRVAGIFKELGYIKIANTIHAEMEGKAWALMGVMGWLRDKLNETRGVFLKGDVQQKGGIGYSIDKLR